MSSVIFQPLLHDPLGWKSTKSTYADHYKWKKYRSTSKDKKRFVNHSQNQKSVAVPTTTATPITTILPTEQTVKPIDLKSKTEENRGRTSALRSVSAKTPVTEHTEEKIRPASVHESTRLPSAHVESEKKPSVDPNNDNSRHWLTYPNPKTPEYIIDIKKRLGQWKVPTTLANRPSSASNPISAPQDLHANSYASMDTRPSSASSQKASKKNDDQHNFLTFERRDTPDELRAARQRLDKHRYHPSLDNYPSRPQTCPVRTITTTTNDVSNVNPTGNTTLDEEREDIPVEKHIGDAWTVEANPFEQESTSSIVVQMVDCEGLPPEYADALETASAAQEEYQRNLKMMTERRLDSTVYRLPAMSPDSLTAYQIHQNSMPTNHQLSQSRQGNRTPSVTNHFGTWVRSATDKERASAMKILQEVLHQPVTTMETTNKTKTVFKQPPAPPPVRTASATRKLGRTRTQHKFPCEICEKLLIKRHVWDLNGPDSITCNHDRQQVKPASRP